MASSIPEITELKLLQKQRILQVKFADKTCFELSCEYLRVFSPSAEVRGHGQQPLKLVLGKQDVNIIDIQPVGNYAVKFIFDDGHNSGIYTWQTLYDLGRDYLKNWQNYQHRRSLEYGE